MEIKDSTRICLILTGEKIVMILDNARIHHAKLIQPFLDAHKNTLQLLFLPPYSPNLNLSEGLWGWLKNPSFTMCFTRLLMIFRRAVRAFLNEISKNPMQIVDRLCVRL